jgi:uncharacterized Ntn-hydrolase superfamily protein
MDPRLAVLLFAVALPPLLPGSTNQHVASEARSSRPASYAILARDPLTGEYGVAATSHAPLIGVNLEFLAADVGGVVVLGGPYLHLNEIILTALREGLAPDRAIAVGLAADPDRERRQVLALSPAGTAAFSGQQLRKQVSHQTGEQFVTAGHQLEKEGVVQAMAEAFSEAEGPLADRLLVALVAGRDAGGERDGERSAALLVVGPGAQFATRDRLVDLRIDYVLDDAVSALVDLRARVDSVYEVLK